MLDIAIIQARTGSQRLPGKILKRINGKTLLQYVIERVDAANLAEVVVAMPKSDETAEIREITGYRGEFIDIDEHDVAGRFREVLKRHPCKRFVRICADSPLIDPKLIDTAISIAQLTGAKIVSNPSYPHGQQVEVVDMLYFLEREPLMTEVWQREHVTSALYDSVRSPEMVTFNVFRDMRLDVSLAVDYQRDFERIERVMGKMLTPHQNYGWWDVLELAQGD